MHLWSCTTDRGTPSSVAPGPPSRQFSAWLRSERPASPSEHTLHKSEQGLFSISSTFFISASSSSFSWCLSFFFSPLPAPFLKMPLTPQRQPSDSSESLQSLSQKKLPLPCLFVSKHSQIKTTEETRGETHRAKDAF